MITTSGLKVGDAFSIAELDAAGQRLVDSGLFAKVGYRTTTKGNLLTVVFQIEETKGRAMPLVFDNFVWFARMTSWLPRSGVRCPPTTARRPGTAP